jgi:hypothetical protein
MTFFHDLNKRLSQLAEKQDLHESKVAESEKWIQKAVNPAHKGGLHKALHVAQGEKIPKAKIEKATHSKNPKLRHMAQFAKNVAHEDIEQEGNAFTGALKATPKGGKFKVGGKEFKDTSSIEEGQCPKCAPSPCSCNEGNAFTAALAKTPKGGKFKVGGKEFTDNSSIEEGFKEMDAWMASREKEKGTGKFDRKERTLPSGMKATTYTRRHEDDEEDDKDDSKSDQADKYASPKKKGRPKSAKPKDQERVTKGSHKYKTVDGKRVKKEKTKEDLDADGVMMTRPSNMSSEGIEHGDEGEYNDEAGMAKDSLHTIIRHARELESALRSHENLPEWVQEKIGQIKGMMSSVTDYIISTHERDVEQRTGQEGVTVMPEGWRGGGLGEPSVVKTRTSKNADATQEALAGLEAIATRGGPGMDPRTQQYLLKIAKTLHKALAKPESTELDEKAVSKAQRKFMGMAHAMQKGEKIKGASPELKKVAKTMKPSDTHDFAATKEKGLPEKVKAKKEESKEEKVDETTVAGSVAPAQNAAPKASKGMQFGKGVYEGFNNQVESMITESIHVESKMQECGDGEMAPAITITADGEEAAKLMMLLKLAGLESQIPKACPTCGASPCGCDEMVDENAPDWPTDKETLDADPNLRTYSGGLNGPKSSGQTTIPVINRDPRRQASMEESVELERTLFKTWKNYKG